VSVQPEGGCWVDFTGRQVKVGDRIQNRSTGKVSEVLDLVACEHGCTYGAAGIEHPVAGAYDNVCLYSYVVVVGHGA